MEAAFSRIQLEGEHLLADANGLVPAHRYRATLGNIFWFRNHFQGIQRLADSDYLFLSGANPQSAGSDLFVVRLGAGNTAEVVKHVRVDPELWHAGGLSLLGTTLALPVYGSHPRHAKILFFDVSDPEHPRRLDVEIDRPGRKASATAMARLGSGHFLVGVISAFDGLPRRVDFYLSRTASIADGFDPEPVIWRVSEVEARPGQKATFSFFQGINFVRQADGRLFMIGFHNSSLVPAFLPGRDHADLYEVEFPAGTTDAPMPRLAGPHVTKIATRQLRCTGGYCNMDAAAGLFVDADTQSLSVYATPGWLKGGHVKITVFSPHAASSPFSSPDRRRAPSVAAVPF